MITNQLLPPSDKLIPFAEAAALLQSRGARRYEIGMWIVGDRLRAYKPVGGHGQHTRVYVWDFEKDPWESQNMKIRSDGTPRNYLDDILSFLWISEYDLANFDVENAPRYVSYGDIVAECTYHEIEERIATEFIEQQITRGFLKALYPGNRSNITFGLFVYDDVETSLQARFGWERMESMTSSQDASPEGVSESIDGIEVIAALFVPVTQKQIIATFPSIDTEHWKELFVRADRNGLASARQGKEGKRKNTYNPARVAKWLEDKGVYSREHLDRILGRILPLKNQDKKHLLGGEIV